MFQKSDMFKKIKSIFVIDESPEASAEMSDAQDSSSTQVSSGTTATPAAPSPTISGESGKPDQKFTDLLLKAIESNNFDGFDYLEYKNSLKSIEAVIPDEGMRFKSAFEMAKTMGLSKDKLIQSAEGYLNILVSEDKKFKDALENQKAKQIQGRSDQLASIEKSILDKQKMIENLNKEIEASKNQLSSVRNEINDAVVRIDVTNQQFVASYNLVYNQIYQDIQKIKSNL